MRKSSGIVKNRLPQRPKNALNKLLRRCWIPLAILIITLAVISSVFRAMTPWAKQYKTEVEQHLSTLIGEPVTISTMETGWYWFEPVIKLNQVAVLDGKQKVITLNKLLVGINIFSSLWHWQIQPGVLYIDDLHLVLRQDDQRWQIEGLSTSNPEFKLDAATYQPVLAWILAQQKIIINNFSAQIHLQDGSLIPLKELDLVITNHSGRYRIKGKAALDQNIATNFELLADLNLDPYALQNTKGNLYLATNQLLLSQWQSFFPQTRFQLLDGQGDIEIWGDLAKGLLENIQAKLHFKQLTFLDNHLQKKQLIPSLQANLAWHPTAKGWQLSADQLLLDLGKKSWPENEVLIRYETASKNYFVFIKKLLLQSLLATAIEWPEAMKPVLAAQLQGELYDTQVQIKPQGIDYVLTRFTHLQWQAQKRWPGVNNLAGVVHWQPAEGRLEIDSSQLSISPLDKPAAVFPIINAALEWKTLSHGLRLSMDRFVLSHPDLVFSASGVIDDLTLNSAERVHLNAQFSAKNAQQWLPYLPSAYLKNKLDYWLKNDIKRIETLSGELLVDGLAADFPFDKQAGEFSIKAHVSGLDLLFAPGWPLTQDIAGYIRFNKRNLEADVNHANLNNILVDKANLRIDDVGLDKETLLIRTHIDSNADQALEYVLSSPLKKKMTVLSMLQMNGLLTMDLQLEIPLYPENDEVLALGEMIFKDTDVTVHHSLTDMELNKLNGMLQFDQEGVLDSNLTADIMEYPVELVIKSIRKPEPYTEIRVKGETTIDILKTKFNLPVLALMYGNLWLESVLTLTDDPGDLDHIRLQSSLRGLRIDLPQPFGKTAQSDAPLTVDMDFNPQKAVRLRLNYANRLSSDIWFARVKDAFNLQKGEIRIGSAKALWQKQMGLQVVGTLSNFDLQQWTDVLAKFPRATTQSNSLLHTISFIDILVYEAKIWQQNFQKLTVKANKLANGEWTIHLNEASLAARVNYRPATNTLKGTIDRLHIPASDKTSGKVTAGQSLLKPADMPNLDLHIQTFKFSKWDLGSVDIKTTTFPHFWQLDYCKIKSPSYQLIAKGGWKKENKINYTKIQAELNITDLATTLERWKISPVVEAKKGTVLFQGSWPGGFQNFSVAHAAGQLAMSFKNGRITHLSPETEEKLDLGKLLSILSLQTIPRRLKLDFSDLSKDGYSFDIFNGNFTLSHGVMTTNNSYIDGPVAYASMKGNLNIEKQLYDVDLEVSPHITASLPVVATIAGGPIAGIATWVASKIINHGMQKVSAYTYKISGPWQQPVVQQVSIIRHHKSAP